MRTFPHIRIEGGARSCSYCNRVLTFNMMARPDDGSHSCPGLVAALAREAKQA